MEIPKERKMSIKRAESQTSTHSRTPSVKWREPVLSPTFHDIQIEQVHIIEPSNGTVKFNEHSSVPDRHSAGDRSSAGLKMLAPPPSEEGSLGTNQSDERKAFREKYLYEANVRVPSGLPRTADSKRPSTELRVKWANKDRASTVPLVNLPLDPVGTFVPRDQAISTRQQSRQSEVVEQRHRQKLAIIRHMQRLQSDASPQQRRLMSGSAKKRQRERYYEVAPGIVLTELPEDEYPHTAPEFRISEEDVNEIYEGRAKTVPRMTKSVIWTAKNRIASSRAVSSNSSRWRSNELSDMESNRKANIFIKIPFKQSPYITMDPQRQEDMVDDIVRPGYELRLTTAFTVSRVKKGLKRLEPPAAKDTKTGKLVKGRLKPLCPVKLPGPNVRQCQGIQPESKVKKKSQGYTPSPSRQRELKNILNKAYEEQRLLREEYEQKMIRAQSATSRESVHRTSPEPGDYKALPDDDIVLNKKTGLDENYYFDSNPMAVSNQLDSMHLDSGVIF